MTPLRLLFDDCLSKNAVKALANIGQFSRGALEVSHLAELGFEGHLDDDWIPQLSADGYLLVTTDRGKKKSRGGKLPVLCQRNGMRHVMMSAAVHQLNQFDKLRAIFTVWTKLVEAQSATPGSAFLLRKKHPSGFDLVGVAPRQDDQRGPLVQKTLTGDESQADDS